MAAIALSLASLFFGHPLEETQIEMWGAADRLSEPFWTVFAVFFPAVTGIMAGVNMSGDLANPGRSIPRGTFAAVRVGYVIYMALPVILAMRADAVTLIEDPLIMRKMAFWGAAILLGVWGATLSSAVGSILGAPRVLQALARDEVLPRWLSWLGKGSGDHDAPRAGTLLTLGLALLAVYFGNLNIIAPVLTMFFLTTYGVLNITAGVERFLGSPSFRPLFKVHWAFSLLGALGCIAVMLLINAAATAVAALVVLGIFVWLERRGLESAWGDVRHGLGALVPNTILLGDSQTLSHRARYCQMIEHFFKAKRNVIIVRDDEQRGFGNRRHIDVWWGGLKGNGGLMMILAYLLQTDLSWHDAQVHLKMVVPTEAAAERARANLRSLITRLRTGAVLDVIVSNGRSFDDILHESSRDADLIFLGMAEPDGDFMAYYEQLRTRTRNLPSTVFVLAAEEIAFREVLLKQEDEQG